MLSDSQVDLSAFRAIKVFATYDSRTFESMGYILVDNNWHKKNSVKVKAEVPKSTRIFKDLAAVLTKEVDNLRHIYTPN